MSADATLVTERHRAYIAAHTTPEDAFALELKRAALAAGIPAIWIAPEQAVLMQVLLRAAGAREVLEVGTLAGLSAILMARALGPDGRVLTVELDPQRAAFAREWIARSDVAERVTVLEGAGADLLPGLPDASADAVFLDADKRGYETYLRQGLRILRPRGLMLVDNAFAFGQLFDEHPTDPEAEDVRRFNEVMAREAALHSIIVPVGDGLWVGVKRPL